MLCSTQELASYIFCLQLPQLIRIVANLIGAAQQLVAMKRPSESEYNSVENYIHAMQPLDPLEQSWIEWKEDLVTLRPGREYAWLDSTIEQILRWTKCKLVEVIQTCPIIEYN